MTDLGAPAATAHRSLPAQVLIWTIGLYQNVISPTRLPTCRYLPTCSSYALEAVELHGAARGGWLALRRLLRCHPWHAGGHDPVPPRVAVRDDAASDPRVSADSDSSSVVTGVCVAKETLRC